MDFNLVHELLTGGVRDPPCRELPSAGTRLPLDTVRLNPYPTRLDLTTPSTFPFHVFQAARQSGRDFPLNFRSTGLDFPLNATRLQPNTTSTEKIVKEKHNTLHNGKDNNQPIGSMTTESANYNYELALRRPKLPRP